MSLVQEYNVDTGNFGPRIQHFCEIHTQKSKSICACIQFKHTMQILHYLKLMESHHTIG